DLVDAVQLAVVDDERSAAKLCGRDHHGWSQSPEMRAQSNKAGAKTKAPGTGPGLDFLSPRGGGRGVSPRFTSAPAVAEGHVSRSERPAGWGEGAEFATPREISPASSAGPGARPGLCRERRYPSE